MNTADSDRLPEDVSRARWHTLVLLSVYHLVLGIALVIVGERPGLLKATNANPELFGNVAQIFAAVSIVLVTLSIVRRPPFTAQVYTALLSDVVLLTWLMHAAGGANSGYGLLLAVSLALGVLLTGGITPILFAALASTAVIGEQTYSYVGNDAPLVGFLHAGLLGAAYFSIGLLNFVLSRRLDTTARIIQEQHVDLADLNSINELVIGLLDLGVIVVDADGRTKIANQVARSWLGTPAGDSAPPISELAPELGKSFALRRSHSSLASASELTLEINGKELGVEFRDLGDNEYRGTIILLKDMARVRAESHRVKLAAIGQMSAGMAHEIRNPLSAISQGAQLLEAREDLPPQGRQVAGLLVRNCERLNNVVENVLSLSRNRQPVRQPVPLCAFIEWVTEQLQSAPWTAGARITAVCRADSQALIDPRHLEEVLHILVENAIRHAQKDTEPAVNIIADLDDNGRPVLDVHDNGPGISPATARRIFDPFFSTSTGTGLGLFLARQFCEANRASLKLNNALPAQGAKFRIRLSPLQP